MLPGYWPTTYWTQSYWTQSYWPGFIVEVPEVSPDTGFIYGGAIAVDRSQEILLTWDETLLEADFIYEGGDLLADQGITGAVIISWFTDARAADDDILPDFNSTDRRGWWSDLVVLETEDIPEVDLADPEVEGDHIGSLLWLLERSKTIPSVLIDAKRYARDALQWFIDDGVASSIIVDAERQGTPGNDRLALSAQIIMIDGHVVTIRLKDILLGG